MIHFKVIVPKLNVRRAPVSDFANKSNIITTVGEGFELDLEEVHDVPNPSLGKWFRDSKNQYYSEKGLKEVAGQPMIEIAKKFQQQIILTDPESVRLFQQNAKFPDQQINLSDLLVTLPNKIINTRGKGISVAVLDTGIEKKHLDIAKNLVFSKDYTGSNNADSDIEGHGTAMSSIIAGSSFFKDKGVTGIANEARILTGKVLYDENPKEIFKPLSDAIHDTIINKADIVNLSIGFFNLSNADLETKINGSKNIIFIAAAKHEKDDTPDKILQFPANCKAVIPVAAFSKDYVVKNWDALPSPLIIIPDRKISCCSVLVRNYYFKEDGSSVATAIISGITALMLSDNPAILRTKTSILEELKKYASSIEEAYNNIDSQIHYIIKQ